MLGPLWSDFSSKVWFLSENTASGNCSKKSTLQTQMRSYDRFPRLPDSPPRVRAFLNKKQQSKQKSTTAVHFWMYFWAPFLESVISYSFLKICVIVETNCWNKAQTRDLTRPWAKARRIVGQGPCAMQGIIGLIIAWIHTNSYELLLTCTGHVKMYFVVSMWSVCLISMPQVLVLPEENVVLPFLIIWSLGFIRINWNSV